MPRVKRFFPLVTALLIVAISLPVFSSNIDVDSLLQASKQEPYDTTNVNNLLEAAKQVYRLREFEKALKLADETLIIAQELDYHLGIAECFYLQARTNNKLNNHATALELYSKAQPIFLNLNRIDRLAGLYNNVGLIYKNLGRFPNAIEFLSKSLEYYQTLDNPIGIASASNNLGSAYLRLADYERSAESYFRALQIFEDQKSQKQLIGIHQNLANLYSAQKDYQKALKFHNHALKLCEELGDDRRRGRVLGNIADVYMKIGEVDTAFYLTKQSNKLFENVNDELGIATSLDNIGVILSLKEEYNQAIKSHRDAINIFADLSQSTYVASAYNNLGHAFTMLNEYDEALKNLRLAHDLSDSLKMPEIRLSSYQRMYELYERKGDFKTSLDYFKSHSQLKDSLFNRDKVKLIGQIEESYEIEKRERENDLLREQQATQDEVIKRQNLQVKVLIGGLITFLLFAVYYYRINQQKKKTNQLLSEQNEEINRKQVEIMAANQSLQLSEQQLHKANQELQTVNARLESTVKKRTSELQRTNHELDTFLYQSSHALRRPIVHVKGLVQLARLEPDPQEVSGLYDKLDDTATRMDLMLKKLVMASEIYVTEPQVESIRFENLIKEVWDNLTDTLKVQTVKLEYKIPDDIQFKADRKLIKIMFLNLLENAIFYNEATKRKRALVTISLASNPKSIDIKVNDNGIGISEEAIASIFDLFSVGTDKTKGYGLGLYIVKKAVEKLQGVITVSSKRNEYTTFHITLPKDTGN